MAEQLPAESLHAGPSEEFIWDLGLTEEKLSYASVVEVCADVLMWTAEACADSASHARKQQRPARWSQRAVIVIAKEQEQAHVLMRVHAHGSSRKSQLLHTCEQLM
jgi:hypothetical protein